MYEAHWNLAEKPFEIVRRRPDAPAATAAAKEMRITLPATINGQILPGVAFAWTSSAATVASIDATTGIATTNGHGVTTITATTKQLHAVSNNLQLGSFLAGFLVVPLVHLQATFDECRATLGKVFASNLCGSSPQRNVDKRHFFTAFVGAFVRVVVVDCQSDVADCRAPGGVTHLRVTGQIAHQNDFVERGHGGLRTTLD